MSGVGDSAALSLSADNYQLGVRDSLVGINQWDTLIGLYNGGSGKLTGISLTDANPLILTTDQQTAGKAMIAALLPDETIQVVP